MIDEALDWLIEQALRLGAAALNALGLGDEDEVGEAEDEAAAEAPMEAIVGGWLPIDENLGLADGAHRLQALEHPEQLTILSDPVLISNVPNAQLQALYADYLQKATAFAANLAEFDDPVRARELGGEPELPPPRARLGKAAVDTAVAAIKAWVDTNGVPPTDAPGLGDVRPYSMQQPRFANIPVWRLEAEHVIPNGYFNALLEGMRLRRIEQGDEYQQMSTLMIYERAAEWKTSGSGADEGDAGIIRTIKTWSANYFVRINAPGRGGLPEQNASDLWEEFDDLIGDAEDRTLRKIDEEQDQNGTQRGHAAGDSMGDFFAPRVSDVIGRQRRLFVEALDDRLEQAVLSGRTAF